MRADTGVLLNKFPVTIIELPRPVFALAPSVWILRGIGSLICIIETFE